MEFCDKCGGLLLPKRKGKRITLECRKCGKVKTTKQRVDIRLKTPSTLKPTEQIIVVDKKSKFEALPKTNAQCPKCENGEAYWWMMQTRAADEPPTRFFKCTKCSHTWREYE